MDEIKTAANIINRKNRPEIRDDMDHREGEEQETKGKDVTHNEKETKKQHLKQKKEIKIQSNFFDSISTEFTFVAFL